MSAAARHASAIGRGALRVAATGLLLAGLALAAALLAPRLLGFESYVITGGSMSGTYDRGSIVLARAVPVSDLRRGDVITYNPPAHTGVRGPVTHRIVAARRDATGRRVFRTKGDANRRADPWRFTLPQATQARAAFGIPLVGYAAAALTLRPVRMLVIGLPALVIALLCLADLWRVSERAPAGREITA